MSIGKWSDGINRSFRSELGIFVSFFHSRILNFFSGIIRSKTNKPFFIIGRFHFKNICWNSMLSYAGIF